ncbi:MAG: hypothetical protein ACXVYM_04530 [Gaiellaceae bacterium]
MLAGVSFGQVRDSALEMTSRPDASTAVRSATFGWTVTPRPAVFAVCILDEGPGAVCASPRSYSALPGGRHHFSVTAYDRFGKELGSASRSWVVVPLATKRLPD